MRNWFKINLLFILCTTFSCSSKKDLAGIYKNVKHPTAVLRVLENGMYQYEENAKIYNFGKWDYKDKEWPQILFYKWKDIPSFNLLGCETTCVAIVTYSNGELIFQPDDLLANFKK